MDELVLLNTLNEFDLSFLNNMDEELNDIQIENKQNSSISTNEKMNIDQNSLCDIIPKPPSLYTYTDSSALTLSTTTSSSDESFSSNDESIINKENKNPKKYSNDENYKNNPKLSKKEKIRAKNRAASRRYRERKNKAILDAQKERDEWKNKYNNLLLQHQAIKNENNNLKEKLTNLLKQLNINDDNIINKKRRINEMNININDNDESILPTYITKTTTTTTFNKLPKSNYSFINTGSKNIFGMVILGCFVLMTNINNNSINNGHVSDGGRVLLNDFDKIDPALTMINNDEYDVELDGLKPPKFANIGIPIFGKNGLLIQLFYQVLNINFLELPYIIQFLLLFITSIIMISIIKKIIDLIVSYPILPFTNKNNNNNNDNDNDNNKNITTKTTITTTLSSNLLNKIKNNDHHILKRNVLKNINN